MIIIYHDSTITVYGISSILPAFFLSVCPSVCPHVHTSTLFLKAILFGVFYSYLEVTNFTMHLYVYDVSCDNFQFPWTFDCLQYSDYILVCVLPYSLKGIFCYLNDRYVVQTSISLKIHPSLSKFEITFILLSTMIYQSDHYKILHMPRQPSCRGMCKIL